MNIGSAHAGACFVRVGRCRLGSILGSILESFWGPSSPLYSFLVDLGCKLVEKKGSQQKDRKKVHQGNPSNPEEGGRGLLNQYNQGIHRPTIHPLTLHFVPGGTVADIQKLPVNRPSGRYAINILRIQSPRLCSPPLASPGHRRRWGPAASVHEAAWHAWSSHFNLSF